LIPVDEVSGLHNAASFSDYLEKEILRSMRFGSVFTLILIELDNAKHLEETYGARSWLTIIRLMSDILRRSIRRIDEIGRIGKSQFGVLCIESKVTDLEPLVRRVLGQMTATPFNLGSGIQVPVTACFGLVQWDDRMPEPKDIMEHAQAALAKAKSKGPGQFAISSPR
jgi:diguanylate cyclase (GGDEF)-like protein